VQKQFLQRQWQQQQQQLCWEQLTVQHAASAAAAELQPGLSTEQSACGQRAGDSAGCAATCSCTM
jgi:hypothetical protein